MPVSVPHHHLSPVPSSPTRHLLQEKSLADLERRYPPAKRPGEDFHWYQVGNGHWYPPYCGRP
jgi:hypothetical protein